MGYEPKLSILILDFNYGQLAFIGWIIKESDTLFKSDDNQLVDITIYHVNDWTIEIMWP